MSQITRDYFDSATAGGDWTNINNIKASSGYADNFRSSGLDTSEVHLQDLGSRAELPTNATITSIVVRISASVDKSSGSADYRLKNVNLCNANNKNSTSLPDNGGDGNSGQIFTFSGDLDYWGITNEEAIDFVLNSDSTHELAFIVEDIGSAVNSTVYVQWVDCQVFYYIKSSTPVMF